MMRKDSQVQAVGHGTSPLAGVSTGPLRITACLASIRKGGYRQRKHFISVFILRIATGYAEKCFFKGRTKAPALTWISESFFRAERLSMFARQVPPFATCPAMTWNWSVHR